MFVDKLCSDCCNSSKPRICNDRSYLCDSSQLKHELADENKCLCKRTQKNKDEETYKNSFVGSFHKPLQHEPINGHLVNINEYNKLVESLLSNNQKRLAEVELATNSKIKLVDPLASLCTPLIGIDKCCTRITMHKSISSDEMASEMVELYGMQLARDVSFKNYTTSPIISSVINHMSGDVADSLPDSYNQGNISISNLFKGISEKEQAGYYISQLLLLNVPMGAGSMTQKYLVPKTKQEVLGLGLTNEWGRNSTEVIHIQNGNLNLLPQVNQNIFEHKYLYSGRALGEAVHNDAAYQFFYQSALILQELKCPINTGFPKYPNQNAFLSNGGNASCLCADA